MRRGPGEWARLSALASLAAFGALVAMTFALLLVHGLVWEDGIEDPTWVHHLVFVALAVPFLAVPGFVVARVAGGRGWRLWLVALASVTFGLGVDLLGVTSPVGVWAGMVTGTLLGIVWMPMSTVHGAEEAPGAQGQRPRRPASAAGVGAAQRTVLVDPPQRRRVPRDVLAPPEGWEVPEVLPPRPLRCEMGDDSDDAEASSRREQPLPSTGRRGGQISSR